ncbi:MAG TPA: ribonuclease P protein component 1 [Candidatus Sulfotelmatobacter sp.]|jgi:ribonuclease P protein subunit POP4|nr:ribonuclease P protein component 1 [Candidatus Sulfotelmatobacter sp.]
MKVTSDIIKDEFVGTTCSIVQSSNAGYLGLSGEVIDESKNTFTIMQHGQAKNIIKDVAVFHFRFSDGTVVEINGKLLTGRPEDRLKKTIKRLW